MKFLVLMFLLLSSLSFASSSTTDKSPALVDISVNSLIDYHCGRSGYFNPAACLYDISKCYGKYQWPKTVHLNAKLDVLNTCVSKLIKR